MSDPISMNRQEQHPAGDTPLTVGISLFACDHGTSGIGRYMIQLVGTLLVDHPEHHYHVWVAEEDVKVFPFLAGGTAPHVTLHCVADRWNAPAWSLVWHAAILPSLLRRVGIDVLYLPAGNRRLVPFSATPRVAVVHDLSSFHVKGKYDPLRMFYIRRLMPWLIRRTNHVITISSSSAHDITTLAQYPQAQLTLIGLGYDRETFQPRDADACLDAVRAEHPEVPADYLFYVSRLEHPGKNHVGLLRAFRSILNEDPSFPHDMVFAGGRWNGAEAVEKAVTELGLEDRVHSLGFVSDGVLPALYGAARALVFPSLFEGFGLPVIEAQAVGLPVAAADISSIPEVAGEGAVLFDPHTTASIADAVRRVATDETLRDELRRSGFANARRFTWESAADQTLEVLLGIAHGA